MKNHILIATVGILAIQSAGYAADLPARSVPPAFAAVPGSTWSGFYVGAQFGTGFGSTTLDVPGAFALRGLGSDGMTFGLTGGVDYQFAPGFVAGLAVDANLDRIDSSLSVAGFSARARDDRSWAVRGRLGFLLTPDTLVYATGGWTQMHTQFDTNVGISNSVNRNGWLVGAGLESRLWGNWFTKAEYVYESYERTTFPGTTLRVEPHAFIGRAGLTYHFGAYGPTYAAAQPAITRANWTGFYVGLQLGYGQANTKITADPILSLRGLGSSGIAGGFVAGYDWQISPLIVIGAEADLSTKTIDSRLTLFGTDLRATGEWDWSARARAGLLLTPGRLAYVTAGYAQTHVKFDTGGIFDWSHTMGGFQFGAGSEFLVTPNVSIRAEYLETIYSKQTVFAPLAIKTTEGKARVGITYKFGGGESAPVLAKY